MLLNRSDRKTFIYSKYRDHVYCQIHPLHADQAALNAVSMAVRAVLNFVSVICVCAFVSVQLLAKVLEGTFDYSQHLCVKG